jgi:dTDP-4-amino-4,6-dideoxygalactose transaminase
VSPEADFIPIARPCLGEQEAEAAGEVIRSGWVTQGPQVAAFEAEFAEFVGAEFACAVSSCTAALHLALLAVGVGPGDEVITVSHSFIATANSIRHAGATPVFADIEPRTYNIDPGRLPELISERTRAILCVHQMGMPCDMDAIIRIAADHGLAVVEDAACAAGSETLWQGTWRRIGDPMGDVVCFSFHPRKVLTTGDGGMLTTDNPEYDKRFRLWRQHGMSVPDTVRHGSRRVIFEEYAVLGYNYRMTDIQAAVGREQLKRLPCFVDERRQIAALYAELLADTPAVTPPHEPAWAQSNWQSYCVRLPDGCDQRATMQTLLDRGIATRRGIMCAHREPSMRGVPGTSVLRESERAQESCILLPIYSGLRADQVRRVVDELRVAVA